jgi:hypothetical protein
MATANAEHLIEIRVDRLAQLFHTLDPFPFRERDLDQDAERIHRQLGARSGQDRRPYHIPDGDALDAHSQELNEAFHRYFAGRAVAVSARTQRAVPGRPPRARDRYPDPRCMLRPGASCRWVANWRPLEIFLYDWWPLTRRCDLYRRLASAARTNLKARHAIARGSRLAEP